MISRILFLVVAIYVALLMVKLKSRYQCPVGGFQFIDAPISDQALQTWDFESLVRQVEDRRRQNPRFGLPVDTNAIRNEVDQQNALRMLSIQNAESYITADPGGAPPNFPSARPQKWAGVAGVASRAGALAAGAAILRDWLGDGGTPVAKELANGRAGVCATCPQNEPGDWMALFTAPAQEFIRGQLNVRKDLNCTTPFDDQLRVCKACFCPLKLKVHVPLEHIKRHLSDGARAKLDARCWITDEMAKRT